MKTRKERKTTQSYSIAPSLLTKLKKHCKDNHINHSLLIQKMIEKHLDSDSNNERMYNQTQLIAFGNYLLSDFRKVKYVEEYLETLNTVLDDDIVNYFDSF